MRLTRQEVGRRGEVHAQKLLEARGYRIVDVNVRFGRHGEIDIIAWDGPTLCFVEVKTRTVARRPSSDREITPGDAVTPAKQRQIAQLAQQYTCSCGFAEGDGPPLRFDVVAVEITPVGSIQSARICPGAFFAPDELSGDAF